MEKFQSVKECPKCGKERFTKQYNTDTTKSTYVPASLIDNQIVSEHLIVKCTGCGYEWQEQCKDNND